MVGRPRARAAHGLGGQRLGGVRRRRAGDFEAFREMAPTLPGRRSPVIVRAAAGGRSATTRAPGSASITAPTLVDPRRPRTRCSASPTARHIAGLIPGARLEILEGVGHMFWWEQPERSAELVREHVLARVPAEAPLVERGGQPAAALARERVLDAELVEHARPRARRRRPRGGRRRRSASISASTAALGRRRRRAPRAPPRRRCRRARSSAIRARRPSAWKLAA